MGMIDSYMYHGKLLRCSWKSDILLCMGACAQFMAIKFKPRFTFTLKRKMIQSRPISLMPALRRHFDTHNKIARFCSFPLIKTAELSKYINLSKLFKPNLRSPINQMYSLTSFVE